MAIRAQAVKSVFQRMPRLVREVADMTGKSVRLVTEGEGTEVDASQPLSVDSVRRNMKRFADLGLQIHVSELDVRLPLEAGVTGDLLKRQAEIYRSAASLCVQEPRCTYIGTWGFTDRYSWIPGAYPGWGGALIFDANFEPKPALQGLLDALSD